MSWKKSQDTRSSQKPTIMLKWKSWFCCHASFYEVGCYKLMQFWSKFQGFLVVILSNVSNRLPNLQANKKALELKSQHRQTKSRGRASESPASTLSFWPGVQTAQRRDCGPHHKAHAACFMSVLMKSRVSSCCMCATPLHMYATPYTRSSAWKKVWKQYLPIM